MTIILGLIALGFWIWMIVDCANNEPVENNQRTIWIIVIIFTFVIGAIIYYITRKLPRDQLR